MKRYKRGVRIICVLGICCMLGACGRPGKEPVPTPTPTPEVQTIPQIQGIGELATLKCSFHNVAVINKEKGTGLIHWGEKDRKMWIVYTGMAEVSYDVTQIRYEQDGVNIRVTLPEPKVVCYEDWVDESNRLVSDTDNWFQKNPITEEEIRLAIAEGNSKMRATFINDTNLLRMAREQAKELIEAHIRELGAASGTEYQVTFVEE